MEMASQAVQLERTEITLESPDETPAIIDVSKTISGDVDESEIAALAYELWQERGCPIGSPDKDWFRAEQELKHS